MVAKPLSSLSSTLLARKGGARPAMRPQSVSFSGGEDLGWNDMGPDPAVPVVLVEREALAREIAAPDVVRTISVATAARIRRETAHAGKSAFTLRVDADRHLRMRLVSAITNRSAQTLVTDALDALLAAVPEVEKLVAQLPAKRASR